MALTQLRTPQLAPELLKHGPRPVHLPYRGNGLRQRLTEPSQLQLQLGAYGFYQIRIPVGFLDIFFPNSFPGKKGVSSEQKKQISFRLFIKLLHPFSGP